MLTISFRNNHIGAVMVSILVSGVVGAWLEPRSCQTKDCTLGICCLSGKLLTDVRSKGKQSVGLEPSGATFLPADCCFSSHPYKHPSSG